MAEICMYMWYQVLIAIRCLLWVFSLPKWRLCAWLDHAMKLDYYNKGNFLFVNNYGVNAYLLLCERHVDQKKGCSLAKVCMHIWYRFLTSIRCLLWVLNQPKESFVLDWILLWNLITMTGETFCSWITMVIMHGYSHAGNMLAQKKADVWQRFACKFGNEFW